MEADGLLIDFETLDQYFGVGGVPPKAVCPWI
jgi:hypothetical protein